ncbi:ribulose-phosphate 3-epimerase isoform X4 [Echeneis naucrates]|uniref:ribulose-phosphate 3-epimerase isoform X4 n=1 Tax=Echeneis naucrates TaxID=173247 RepID=UPI0011134CB2|nr:ribulose-phosphate 3-epimerase-like isoform X4 [Echeneis naucrates]
MAYSAKIGPSILSSDLSCLGSECVRMMECGADYLHLDVMDGHFVPNITFGHPMVECLRKAIGQDPFFDMHMMVSRPEQWVKPMAAAGANQYTFHLEATTNPGNLIKEIKESSMKVNSSSRACQISVGLAIKPGTTVSWLRSQFPSLDIEVDGGVGPDTIHKCAEAGANMIVSGSAVVGSDDPRSVISLLRTVVAEAIQKRSLDR